MQVDSDDQFYSQLTVNRISLSDLLSHEQLFTDIPNDWHVIITDIKGSTQAVINRSHQDVNFIAAGSIVTVLNIAYSMNITIPFFFGGDGATFIVPSSIIDLLMQALSVYRSNTLSNFNLNLRTGTVSVKDIYAKGYKIRIAKFSRSENFSIPIVLGDGLDYAEKVIKGKDYLFSADELQTKELNLTGMQCRWDKILPPQNKEEVVTLLVIARNVEKQALAYKKVLQKMDELYGSPDKRQPISVARLKMKTTFNRLGTEMQVRLGKIVWFELLKNWFISFYGYIYFNTKRGKRYLESLVAMSDTLVIDGKINTVITGTAAQRTALQKLLDEMELNEDIIYGLHISNASVMSCYVRNLEDDHIHFVDGSDGGYTQAARMLKAKLKN